MEISLIKETNIVKRIQLIHLHIGDRFITLVQSGQGVVWGQMQLAACCVLLLSIAYC